MRLCAHHELGRYQCGHFGGSLMTERKAVAAHVYIYACELTNEFV